GSEDIEIFSTSPQSKDLPRETYLESVAQVARWSEEAGCTGILVYTDNGLVDPWLLSHVIVQNTRHLSPLVAVQSVYMHPYTAAKMVATLGYLYGRRLHLNLVAGGFKNDLLALGDETPHDDRYLRTTEYALIVRSLLAGTAPTSFEGKYYTVKNLKMTPSLPEELFPGMMISGSSEAGFAAAQAIGATAIRYPKPPGEDEQKLDPTVRRGVRVGVIARENGDAAWEVALARFPEDRKGQLTHQLSMKVSDSQWHRQLSELGERPVSEANPYWLGPFKNYKTFCPYLVGSYERVAAELARYVADGCSTFILDIPASREELEHTGIVFDMVRRSVRAEEGRIAQGGSGGDRVPA
ncbi:MAG TPA: LLM class flavin-dependent oxidoreductase, partial [Trueperaceae bacterium]